MTRRLPFALALLVPALAVAACSGKAVVEPAGQTSKRAELFLDKCDPPPLADESDVEEVYLCLPAEDVCGEPDDPLIVAALRGQVEKSDECGKVVELLDVPCGPDLNAVQCCYAARVREGDPCP